MGLFSKRQAAPLNRDPHEAIRIAQEALAATGTYVDEHGRRRKLTPEMRESMTGGLDSAARALASGGDLPIWPSGIARVSDGILEVTTGDGIRVAVRDIKEIGVEPPRAGRLSLTLRYAAGLDKVTCSYWVEAEHEAALNALVDRVNTGV